MKQQKKGESFLFFITLAFIIVLFIPFYFKDKEIRTFRIKPINYLSYEDLIKLVSPLKPQSKLYLKLEKQLTVPYVVNKTNIFQNRNFDKPFLRLAQWNIARGYNVNAIKDIFGDHFNYYYNYKKNIEPNQQGNFKKELYDLSKSDIISLNEVDIGMPRTRYKNIVSELSDALNYNCAFATEFVELGPLIHRQKVDPKRYLGLHGNAIFSRYPIEQAKIIRLPECYRWFDAELARKSPLESARRIGAKTIFNTEILSEVRRGGRNALLAQIRLPTKQLITVVVVHLEDRCYPNCRLKQTEHLLANLKNLYTPVVIAGDFNTTTTDSAPTSVKKEIGKRIKDPHFIARQIAFLALPIFPLGVGNLASGAISQGLHYKDPTVPSVPVFFPNQERQLFVYLKNFRFLDGEGFDFKGDSNKSSNGKRGLLANSNERQLKGFESTFRFVKPMGIGYYKLDWFFVKPKNERFKPFNGQTLKLVNEAYTGMVSDHDPITVDLSI